MKNWVDIILDQRIWPQVRHFQVANGKKVAADLCILAGKLVVHHTGIIYDYIARLDQLSPVTNQIFACAAVNNADFHMSGMRVHDTWITADLGQDLPHIIKLWFCLGRK